MIRKIKQGTKWTLAAMALLLVALAALAAYTNVSTEITDADRAVFAELGLANQPPLPWTYLQEIAAIRQVQHEVFQRAPFGEGIPDYQAREPAD